MRGFGYLRACPPTVKMSEAKETVEGVVLSVFRCSGLGDRSPGSWRDRTSEESV